MGGDAVPRPGRLEAVHPVLMCRDVSRTMEFFQRLGFRVRFIDDSGDPRYAGVSRDAVELHLQWHDDSQWDHEGDLPCYRFLVRDIDAVFSEFESEGIAPGAPKGPWCRPADTPWGTREFHLHDPDGNVLQFYQSS